MLKIYITAIPLQGRGGLEKGIYMPQGFALENNRETSFPIIPVIAEEIERKDRIRIITLRTENTDTQDNYDALIRELAETGVEETQIIPITIPEDQSRETGADTLMRIMDAVPDDSLVYADITFGTKPLSIMIMYAAILAEKLKDTEVEGIFYGELPRTGGRARWEDAKLYDLTIYKRILDVAEDMSMLELNDPADALKRLLDM